MAEVIQNIEPWKGKVRYSEMAGFKVTTAQRDIILAIDDESSCCESWGYFLTEDRPAKYVGAALLDVCLTDTNRSTKSFSSDWNTEGECLDEGDVMFVDIVTDMGTLQFVAYNAHNGYYGHTAIVFSRPHAIQDEVLFSKVL